MVSESPCLVLLRSSPSCEPYDNGENEHSLGQYNKEGVVVHILYECTVYVCGRCGVGASLEW